MSAGEYYPPGHPIHVHEQALTGWVEVSAHVYVNGQRIPVVANAESVTFFPDKAYSRNSDPQTSRDAALRVDTKTTEQVVLDALRDEYNGLTTVEIAQKTSRYIGSITPRMKPLETRGYVTRSGKRDGRTVWTLAAYPALCQAVTKQDPLDADEVKICECGATNAYDKHTDTCWARPMHPMNFGRTKYIRKFKRHFYPRGVKP
jgi:hypothetical protein